MRSNIVVSRKEIPFNFDAWQTGQGAKCSTFNLNDTCFDEYWSNVQDLADTNGTAIDGYSFLGRMAVVKHLIFGLDPAHLWERRDTTCHFREWHWLWGYACQMDWQHRSGRLLIGASQMTEKDRISKDSWWGYMNFCFSVCIFVGAQRAGITTMNIEFDIVSTSLLENDKCVQQCVGAWEHLFNNGYIEFKDSIHDNVSDETFRQHSFQFHQAVWEAHTSVIECVVGLDTQNTINPIMPEMLCLLTEAERNFGLGWCRMVDILAACCFPTDLVTLKQDGAGFLPIQIVSDEGYQTFQKTPSALSKMEQMRYTSVKSTHELYGAPESALFIAGLFMKRVVQTNSVRRSMPRIVNGLTHGTIGEKVYNLLRVLALFVRPRGPVEWSFWFTLLVVGMCCFRTGRSDLLKLL